jgi:hypothetical protein
MLKKGRGTTIPTRQGAADTADTEVPAGVVQLVYLANCYYLDTVASIL